MGEKKNGRTTLNTRSVSTMRRAGLTCRSSAPASSRARARRPRDQRNTISQQKNPAKQCVSSCIVPPSGRHQSGRRRWRIRPFSITMMQ